MSTDVAFAGAATASGTGVSWFAKVKKYPSASVGAVILLVFGVLAVIGPWIMPYPVDEKTGPVYGAPSMEHWLGLDDAGVDMLSLLLYGARTSLVVGVCAALVAVVIGGTVGVLSGYYGGATDTVLMRITDYFLVIPDIVLMIVIAAVWGPSLWHIILVIGLLLWTTTARVVRAQVKSLRERGYVKRARSAGATHPFLIVRHILPQVTPLLVASTVISVATAIFDEAALSFLGLGDPSSHSWGITLENASQRSAVSYGAWWAVVPAGLCIASVIVGCYLVGRSIEDALNPRLGVAHLSIRSWRLRPLVGRGRDAL